MADTRPGAQVCPACGAMHGLCPCRVDTRPIPIQTITLTEDGAGRFQVAHRTLDSAWPTTSYPTAMAAAARVLQLLNLDIVAAQQYPEVACIGEVNGKQLPHQGGENG